VRHAGDPTPRSARDVLADVAYKMAATEQIDGGNVTRLVVLHCGTDTHWMTAYIVAHGHLAATWQQVVPVVETHMTWRPVP
jgi:hypothetical protein